MPSTRSLVRSLPFAAALVCQAATSTAQVAVTPPTPPPRIDVVFVIDATGSMGDEIEQVKSHLQSTARSITSGLPRPDVRFGIVVYRDREDTEHTRMVPFTRNVDAVQSELASIQAIGGGDTPEDVDAGLTLAIQEMAWDPAAAHLLFLVGDAAPKDYGVDRQALLRRAREREIRIHSIQASGMDVEGARYFASLSNATGGVAEVLTYRHDVVVDGGPRVLFRRGGDSFVTSRALTPAEAELSFTELDDRHLVVRDETGRFAAAAAPTAGMGGAPGARRATRGGGAAPAAAPAGAADSDIGGIIARETRGAATERGVAY